MSAAVSMARRLERRLEKLIGGFAGKVFSGRLHPSELAARLAREADLARFRHGTGPATANHYRLMINPSDVPNGATAVEKALAEEVGRHVAEEGLRLEGPISVKLEPTAGVTPGSVECESEVAPGPGVAWAKLVADAAAVPIQRNRALIGRGTDADLRMPMDDISRRHALIWQEGGSAWIRDLGSVNGTWVDGRRVGRDPMQVSTGSTVRLGAHSYRFVEG